MVLLVLESSESVQEIFLYFKRETKRSEIKFDIDLLKQEFLKLFCLNEYMCIIEIKKITKTNDGR